MPNENQPIPQQENTPTVSIDDYSKLSYNFDRQVSKLRIGDKDQQQAMQAYYRQLFAFSKDKNSAGYKLNGNRVVELHRQGRYAEAAKILGMKDGIPNDVSAELAAEYDNQVLGIDKKAQAHAINTDRGETKSEREERERKQALQSGAEAKTAGGRMLESMFGGTNKEGSFTGQIPLEVKVAIIIIIIVLWLLGGVGACVSGV